MFFENISYITAIIAAIISMGLGFIWYSPYVFGKIFMKETGMTPEKMEESKESGSQNMAKTYALSTILSVVTALVIAGLLNSLIVTSL